MARPRLPVLSARPRGLPEVLALGELVLEYSLRDGSRPGYAAAAEVPGEALVYGLYEAYEPGSAEPGKVYRRITGGRRVSVGAGWGYAAATLRGAGMESLAAMAAGAEACSRGVAGFTRAAGVGFVELFTPEGAEAALSCLGEALGVEPRGRILVPRVNVSELASLFSAESWRLYRYRVGSGEAVVRRGRYWARLSLEVMDGYVSSWWLTGVFYAAPPSELFTVLNTLRGMRFDEMALYNIELALEKRVETHGLSTGDLISLLRSLYETLGERFYTATPTGSRV